MAGKPRGDDHAWSAAAYVLFGGTGKYYGGYSSKRHSGGAFPMHWYLLDLDTVRMLKALKGFLSTSLIIHSRKEHNSCEMTSEAEIFKLRAL